MILNDGTNVKFMGHLMYRTFMYSIFQTFIFVTSISLMFAIDEYIIGKNMKGAYITYVFFIYHMRFYIFCPVKPCGCRFEIFCCCF